MYFAMSFLILSSIAFYCLFVNLTLGPESHLTNYFGFESFAEFIF